MITRNRMENVIPIRRMNCTRCGSHHGGLCYAFKAKCNKCLKLGHYARVCRSTTENRQKSSRTKQRDNDRMTSFLCKKLFQCQLPFYFVDNEYLKLNEINTTTLKNDKKIQNLENKLNLKCYSFNEQESKLNVAMDNTLALEKENQILKAENKKLSEMHSTTERKLEEACLLLEIKNSQSTHCSKDAAANLIDAFKYETSVYNALKSCLVKANDELTMELTENIAAYIKALVYEKECHIDSIGKLQSRLSWLENTNEDLADKLERSEKQLNQCKNVSCDYHLTAQVSKLESIIKDLVAKQKHLKTHQDQQPRINWSPENDRHYGEPRSHVEYPPRSYNSRYSGRRY